MSDRLRLPSAIGGDLGRLVPAVDERLAAVRAAWPEAAGEALARHAAPARIDRAGALLVHAADASWMHAIELEHRTILRRLGAVMGDAAPTGLRVAIGPVRRPAEVPEDAPTPIDPAARERAREMVSDVADPRLRTALEQAVAKALSRPETP